jgi:NodT family efflux transporter outer membrane factor (OMF) lipoprotein
MRPHAATATRRLIGAWGVARRPRLTALLLALASSLVLALGGCASPAGIAPSATALAPAELGAAGTEPTTLATDWWQGFDDPALSALIERALAGNPNLQAAQARLQRAAANAGAARAAAGPQVGGELDVTRQRFSANSLYPPPLGGAIVNSGNLQASGSWELDFFGRNRAVLEAALGAEQAAEADTQAARLLLATRVARTYLELGRLFEQRAVAQRSLAQREQTLSLIRQRVQAGIDTAVELRQGESALPQTRQQIEALDEQITLARHALAALTVQPPEALAMLAPQLTGVHTVPVPATVPADLLGHRADIAAARWRVEAATHDMAAARAQFYPNVSLTAFIGLSSLGIENLVRSGSEQYGVGPALHLPIFDAGRLRANLRGKAADVDAAVDSYNGVVLDAVREVADQLASLGSIGRQQQQQQQAQATAESAYDLALQRYRAGLGTYLTVLTAEATVLNQRQLAADLKARALQSQVALVQALGGGYAATATSGDADSAVAGPSTESARNTAAHLQAAR